MLSLSLGEKVNFHCILPTCVEQFSWAEYTHYMHVLTAIKIKLHKAQVFN